MQPEQALQSKRTMQPEALRPQRTPQLERASGEPTLHAEPASRSEQASPAFPNRH